MLANHEGIAVSLPTGNDPLGIDDTGFLCSDGELSQSVCDRKANAIVWFLFQKINQKQNMGSENEWGPARCSFNSGFGWKAVPCVMDEGS